MNPPVTGLDLLACNDIYVKANDLSRSRGVTLIALAHNEMYFLPAFLEHYRKLGVERFIVLDDSSTDGTLAYLSAQPDVMVVGSHRRYGDRSRSSTAPTPRAGRWSAAAWCICGA